MVISFSNMRGSAGSGGGATGGTVSGITLWSDETTKAYIDNALSGVTDVLSAYTKTEDFATINGSAITSGGNLVIEATPYTAGTNIDITNHIISVTGISVPTKVSELVNDAGYITTADTQNFVTSGDVQTQINDSISGKADSSAVTTQISEVKTEIEAKIPSKVSDLQNDLNFASTGDVESMISGFTTSGDVKTQIEGYNYINSGQAQTQIDNSISGKLDTDKFTAYTANTQTKLDNKQDISGMTEYATTAFTESTYLKEHQSLSAYSTTEQVQTLINTAKQEVESEIPDVSNFVTSGEVETQITDKGYITGFTETDPVFQASAASGITTQDITNWNNKLDSSDLEPYYTSAQTDTAIQNATNGLASEEWVESQGYLTGYTETDPVFQASAASGISEQDISNWNAKLDSSDLEPYYTSAQTDSAISNATSGKQDTLVSGTNIKTINNQSLLGSGNIEIQGGGGSGSDYSAGANIDITDNVISVTGITVPTKTSDLTNDAGFINSEQAQTQIYSSVSGKVDTDVFTAYTANTKTKIDNAVSVKADLSRVDEIEEVTASALVELHNTKQDILVSGTNIKTINNQSLLGSGNIEIQGGSGGGSNIIELTQAEYDALTAYTEDAIYVITDAQAINMDNYVTTGDMQTTLDSYYTSAQTDTAISNATSGKTDKVSVTANSGGLKFPTWNNQGCITGTSGTVRQVSQSINGSNRYLYSNSFNPLPTIYAPTSAGSAGQPLLSNGSGAPVWGAYKFQFISQSQYDALATKDSTTIYFIVNEN